MKFLALLILSTAVLAGGRRIQNDDYISKTFLRLNLDGILLWEFNEEEVESKIQEFKEKCLNEIPTRVNEHFNGLADSIEFFKRHDIEANYKIVSKRYRGLGEQLICQSTIRSQHPKHIRFKAKYSKIYKDRVNGTMELCREKIAEIDANAIENHTLTRRAYFTYSRRRGESFFPSCQTLTVEIIQRH
jgi:hypothetical protein